MAINKINYYCVYCGEPRLRYPSQVRVLSFCNTTCKRKYESETRLGKNNSNYRHGLHCEDSLCVCGNVKDYRAKNCSGCLHKLNSWFSKDTPRRNASLWRYIKKFDLIPWDKCFICGLGWEWNGKPLSLHLDHIDGDSSNNTLENLQVLCPNCHTQTPTYASRNRRIFK